MWILCVWIVGQNDNRLPQQPEADCGLTHRCTVKLQNAINTHTMSVYGFIGHIHICIYILRSNNNNRWHNLMRVEKIIISSTSDFYRQPSSNMQTTCASGWMDGLVDGWIALTLLFISPGDIFVVKEFHPSSAFLRHGNRRIIYNCQRNCPGADCRPLIYGIS